MTDEEMMIEILKRERTRQFDLKPKSVSQSMGLRMMQAESRNDMGKGLNNWYRSRYGRVVTRQTRSLVW